MTLRSFLRLRIFLLDGKMLQHRWSVYLCCLGNRPQEGIVPKAGIATFFQKFFCLLGQNCHVTTVAIRKLFLPNQYLSPRKGEWILSRQQAFVTACFHLVSHLQSFHFGRSFLSSLFTHQSVILSHFSFKHIV